MKISFKKIILFLVVVCVFIINYCIWTQRKADNRLETTITTTGETTDVATIETTESTVESTSEITTPKETISQTTIPNTTKPKEINITTTKSTTEKTKLDVTTESTTKKGSDIVSLGKFRLTAYCSCSKCCGKWAGSPTASGVMPRANHTIAVDTSVIPFGTKVKINGNTYVAEDTGSAIKGNKIDIYFDNHETASDFGVQYAEVFLINN